MTKDEEFNKYLRNPDFWARWNALQEKLKSEVMTAQEAADYVGLPFEFFGELYVHHEILRLHGLTFADVKRAN